MRSALLILGIAFAVAAHGQAPHAMPPGADPSQFKPLPERRDVLSWKVLGQVDLVKAKDRYVPQFAPSVAALDQKEVKVQGFMLPLQPGALQTHFVLSAMPQTCSFCLPGGPESLVEVKTKRPVKYTFDPVVVSGRLSVLKDDPRGVYYSITDAVQAK